MRWCKKNILTFIQIFFLVMVAIISADKETFLSPERPVVVYYNQKYLRYVNMTARRYGRHSPVYYVSLHYDSIFTYDNNLSAVFSLYEYTGNNKYQRSMLELHFKFCDLVSKDKLFGSQMRQGKLNQPCPYPPGDYHLTNMTFQEDAIPSWFPIRKGRIWANVSGTSNKVPIAAGYIDLELKERKRGRKS